MVLDKIQLVISTGFLVAMSLIVLTALMGATTGDAADAINATIQGVAVVPDNFTTIGTLIGVLILVVVAAPMLGGLFGGRKR